MFTSFPLMYLKRGLLIRLNLSIDHPLFPLKLEGGAMVNGDRVLLSQPQARIFYTKPDEAHSAMLRDRLITQGSVVFPAYVFEGSYQKSHKTSAQSDDISTANSLILKTFVTWLNEGAGAMNLILDDADNYELEATDSNNYKNCA